MESTSATTVDASQFSSWNRQTYARAHRMGDGIVQRLRCV